MCLPVEVGCEGVKKERKGKAGREQKENARRDGYKAADLTNRLERRKQFHKSRS